MDNISMVFLIRETEYYKNLFEKGLPTLSKALADRAGKGGGDALNANYWIKGSITKLNNGRSRIEISETLLCSMDLIQSNPRVGKLNPDELDEWGKNILQSCRDYFLHKNTEIPDVVSGVLLQQNDSMV